MKELKIYEFQAKNIEDAFRMVNNLIEANKKDTAMKRSVMQAWKMIQNVLDEKIDERVSRF